MQLEAFLVIIQPYRLNDLKYAFRSSPYLDRSSRFSPTIFNSETRRRSPPPAPGSPSVDASQMEYLFDSLTFNSTPSLSSRRQRNALNVHVDAPSPGAAAAAPAAAAADDGDVPWWTQTKATVWLRRVGMWHCPLEVITW